MKSTKESDELAAIRAQLQLERAQLSSEISSRLGSLSPTKPNGINPFSMGSASSSKNGASLFVQRPATLGLGAEISDMDKKQGYSKVENARLKGALVGKRKRDFEPNGEQSAVQEDEEEEESRASIVQKGKSKANGIVTEKKANAKIDPFASKKAAKGKSKIEAPQKPSPKLMPTEEELQGMSKNARKRYRKKMREEAMNGGSDVTISQSSSPEKRINGDIDHPKTNSNTTSDENANMTPHQKALMSQLSGARFRQINETLYTSSSSSALSYIQSEPSKLLEYHEGFREQVKGWPKVPVKQIAMMIQKGQEMSSQAEKKKMCGRYAAHPLIVDLGAGEAILAKSLHKNSSLRIVSYDLLDSEDGWVKGLDVAKGLPFPGSLQDVEATSQVVDVAVFCLSLMGTNWVEMIIEANRILRLGGELVIAEVTSRFNTKEDFIKMIKSIGFVLNYEDSSNSHFVLFEFTKTSQKQIKSDSILDETKRATMVEEGTKILKPCIYKRR